MSLSTGFERVRGCSRRRHGLPVLRAVDIPDRPRGQKGFGARPRRLRPTPGGAPAAHREPPLGFSRVSLFVSCCSRVTDLRDDIEPGTHWVMNTRFMYIASLYRIMQGASFCSAVFSSAMTHWITTI